MRRLLLLSLLPIVTAFSSPTTAGGLPAPDLPDPQAIIDACWAVSKEDRESGVNSRMREGHVWTSVCLEKKVIELLDTLKFGESFISRAEAKQELDNLRTSVHRLYWMIYNDNEHCGMSCGSMWFAQHLPTHSKLLEDMIRTMIRQVAIQTLQEEQVVPSAKNPKR